jgi:mRNA interferase HigB
MKRIFAKSALVEYWQVHPETEHYLKIWYKSVLRHEFKSPAEVKRVFATASILKNGRIVFNVKGNSHRLVTHFNFSTQVVYIRFVGTHNQYDKIDANTIRNVTTN